MVVEGLTARVFHFQLAHKVLSRLELKRMSPCGALTKGLASRLRQVSLHTLRNLVGTAHG
jgi:hypothetical protein